MLKNKDLILFKLLMINDIGHSRDEWERNS